MAEWFKATVLKTVTPQNGVASSNLVPSAKGGQRDSPTRRPASKSTHTNFNSKKLDWCKGELKALLQRLIEGNYHQTAETVFDHVAHTGVETDLHPELKEKPTMEEFLKSE